MTVFSLLPEYVHVGIADVFDAIGLLEFFYDQSPEDMRSLGTTFFTSGIGLGNFLNSFLVTAVDKISRRHGGKSWIGKKLNDPHLDYYYGLLLVISTLNLGLILWASRKYVYKRESHQVKNLVLSYSDSCYFLVPKSADNARNLRQAIAVPSDSTLAGMQLYNRQKGTEMQLLCLSFHSYQIY
ncbi:hypothetical protein ACH5RR_019437 [Cinchona calisaya]|uniref:Uncharacterized protein n=1 Tax=Cinchona calisaya TaxID=153742 RepID=A0ABD2ZQL5_9GENT